MVPPLDTPTTLTPEDLAQRLEGLPGIVVLRSAAGISGEGRYSFVTAEPFLTFKSYGSRCEIQGAEIAHTQFGNPWNALERLMSRYELLDEVDVPFPLGGCFGYWGYELKNFTEPKLSRRAVNDLELPDCSVGFYDSLVVFDHELGKTWIVSTGLCADGSRSEKRARERADFWGELLRGSARQVARTAREARVSNVQSNLSRGDFLESVERARRYIRAGDIYQVNMSHRLTVTGAQSGWDWFERLSTVSPAPYAAYFDCGDFAIASSSPEQFLRMSGGHIVTRPIKGTRPRDGDASRDARLAFELQTSPKELAELVMITDLMRNDLGRVCEYGSVQTPELARLERFAQVQHLVSTVEGRLRTGVTHFGALASAFPGGSITGAPKFRAMEIIDELEPLARGPYCGCHGYLGFNRESQLSVTIRTVICKGGEAHFNVGAGIVADSDPAAEYDETMAKAAGFVAALELSRVARPMREPAQPR